MQSNFSITNIRPDGKLPRLPFGLMKEKILGKKYELNLLIANKKLSKKLNQKYRDINKPTDILSFPLNDTSGEIILDLETAKTEAVKFERSFNNFIAFLFIHGLVHLKGFEHGTKMETLEKKYRKFFKI